MITANPKRLFVSVKDRSFLEGLKVPPGQFVPTRLALRLGSKIMLNLQPHETERRLDVPAVVVGRRTPASPKSALCAGVIVRIADPNHPNLKLAEAIVSGDVVDLNEQMRMTRPNPATAEFLSPDELISELRLLLKGDAAQLPLDRPVKRGDRLCVTTTLQAAGVKGQPKPPMPAAVATFVVEVKTVVRHDDDVACLAKMVNDEDAEIVRRLLRTLAGIPDTLRA